MYVYKGIVLSIPRDVFHPGFFFSTKLLLGRIRQLLLQDRTLLELGAGSGLIAISAAKQGALVTATDINPAAVDCLQKNRSQNAVDFRIIHSDLFDKIPPETFDVIAINPPYYKNKPVSAADLAWCCGENGEYFEKLFQGLSDYMQMKTTTLLVLCDGCDLSMIEHMARQHGFYLKCILVRRNLIETNFIYKIEFMEEHLINRYHE